MAKQKSKLKLKVSERIALWFLRKRFSATIRLRKNKNTGDWSLSIRRGHPVWVDIEPELADELCLITHSNKETFVGGEERTIAKYISAVV